MTQRSILFGLTLTLATLVLCTQVQATFLTLAQRLPPASNAVVAVNVARLVASPYGKQAGWDQKLADAWAKQPLMIPPGAQRILMAADVKPSTLDSYWEMSLMEMDQVPSLESIAKDEGGHIDRVWDKDAVASPINAYFVPLDSKTLASITPAERSQIARWVRMEVKPEGSVTSDYIRNVCRNLSATTDIVMAMDLEGAYGVPNIRKWLDTNDIKEVTPENINEVVRVLGTMKGITLTISVDSKVNGKCVVDFDRETSPLSGCAKPIMVAMLNFCGMRIEEVENWNVSAGGKQVTFTGELSDAGLRHLLNIVQSPVPAAALNADSKGAPSQTPADPGQASKKYYKAVCAILDGATGGKSLSEATTWLRNASKRIDQLPILNVDPALVEWGAMVSSRLKQAGMTTGVGQTQVNARVAGVMDPGYAGYAYDSDGSYYYTDVNNKVAQENARSQRRQAAQEQRAQTQQQAAQILSDLTDARAKIRADMVAKYNIEF